MAYLWETHLSVSNADLDPVYHQKPRSEILPVLERPPRRFLDIGCGGGATGGLLKSRYPGAFGVGVELNEKAAAAARNVFDLVLCGDVTDGRLLAGSVERASIDTVLMLDVIEHVYNPWELLKNLHPFLTADAQIVASIPNSFSVQLLEELASGNWNYGKDGLLDITHIRFFTLRSMYELFEQTGYVVRKKSGVPLPPDTLPKPLARTADGIESQHLILKQQTPERIDELFQIQFLLLAAPKRLDTPAARPAVTAPASRNSPCPCGSGKRYKNCCGSLEGMQQSSVAAPQNNLSALMHAALAKQQAGEFSSARPLYMQALELAPNNADALHMLGVMAYMEGDLDTAERHILDAKKNCPIAVPMLENNLALVRGAKLQSQQIPGFCAAALPNVRHRLQDPSARLTCRQPAGSALLVDFSVPGAARNVEALYNEMLRLDLPCPVLLAVNDVSPSFSSRIAVRKLTLDTIRDLKNRSVLIWGIWKTFNHGIWPCLPGRLLLYGDSNDPERFIAAVNFASILGDVPVELLFSSASIKNHLGLPGTILDASAAAEDGAPNLPLPALSHLAHILTQYD